MSGGAGLLTTEGILSAVRTELLSPRRSVWQYVALLSIANVFVALVVQLTLALGASAIGIDTTGLHSSTDFGSLGRRAVLTVLIAPVLETAALVLLLHLLLLTTERLVLVALIAGLVFGAIHASDGVLHFFGPAFAFFLFSCGYLAWYKRSKAEGFVAAAMPHAFANAVLLAVWSWRGNVT